MSKKSFFSTDELRLAVKSYCNNVDMFDVTHFKREDLLSTEEIIETYGPIQEWDVSRITNFSYVFENQENFNEDISGWDVSNATNLKYMFARACSFDQDIGGWDISKAKTTEGMFNLAFMFNCGNGSGISRWNVSNVINMSNMFCNATNFNPRSGGWLRHWNTSNVTDMSHMFGGAENFNPPTVSEYADEGPGNWDVSNVTDMSNMFSGAKKFNPKGWLRHWDTSNVIYMGRVFYAAESFDPPTVSEYADEGPGNWDISNVTDIDHMFCGAKKFNPKGWLKNWNTSNVISFRGMFCGAENFNPPTEASEGPGAWDTSNVYEIAYMFCDARNFNHDISNWNTQNLENITGAFLKAVAFDQNISNWEIPLLTGNIPFSDLFKSSIYMILHPHIVDRRSFAMFYDVYTANSFKFAAIHSDNTEIGDWIYQIPHSSFIKLYNNLKIYKERLITPFMEETYEEIFRSRLPPLQYLCYQTLKPTKSRKWVDLYESERKKFFEDIGEVIRSFN